MKRYQVIFALILLAMLTGLRARPAFSLGTDTSRIQGSISVQKKHKSEYASLARISLQDAIASAAKVHMGKIVEVALEEEDGFLVYEVELVGSDNVRKTVLIDAGNGKTLRDESKNSSHDDEEDDE